MVKSILSVYHKGLRDFIIQRVSALIIAFYSLFLIFYLVFNRNLTFVAWHHLFSLMSMKVATLIFVAALLYHAWIGVWTIFTDYVKTTIIRSILCLLVILLLLASFFWTLLILGSV